MMSAGKWGTSVPALMVIGMAALLGGCVPNAPYHTTPGSPGNCRTAPTDQGCSQAYYQEHDGYDLAFAEFSERGNAFSDRSIEDVLQRIREKAEQEGVVLITFVHGWKHNASEDDQNVVNFRASMQAVAEELRRSLSDTGLGTRRLIGMYVGWRGASIDAPFLIETTFWDRKAVAEEVGKGGVTRLLLELDEITGRADKNVMVVVGHSFGGAIVVSALNEVLTERAVHRTRGKGYARTVGDGVLVLNPAIEANQALSFVEAAIAADYRPEQHPLFVSLSSDADSATHYLFPLGQTVSLLLTWRQADLERKYFYDRLQPAQPLPLREEHLDTTTVGNFAPFLTHRLTASERDGRVAFSLQTCDNDPKACEPSGLTSLSGQPAIRDLPQNYPLYFIKTDDSMMVEHNDIFNSRVRSFAVTVIDDVVRRNLAKVRAKAMAAPVVSPGPSILAQREAFEQRMQEIYERMPERPEP